MQECFCVSIQKDNCRVNAEVDFSFVSEGIIYFRDRIVDYQKSEITVKRFNQLVDDEGTYINVLSCDKVKATKY